MWANVFGYENGSSFTSNIVADSAAAAQQLGTDFVETTREVGGFLAKSAGGAAADSLGPAATATGLPPGGQGVSAVLTVANVAVNGGISEALGASSGKATSVIVDDILTNSGNSSGNWKTRVLSTVASTVVETKVTEVVQPVEENMTGNQ